MDELTLAAQAVALCRAAALAGHDDAAKVLYALAHALLTSSLNLLAWHAVAYYDARQEGKTILDRLAPSPN